MFPLQKIRLAKNLFLCMMIFTQYSIFNLLHALRVVGILTVDLTNRNRLFVLYA